MTDRRRRTSATASRAPLPGPRDPEATRERMRTTSRNEFCEHGFSGARAERIARAAKADIQMLYRHFGDKQHLYIAVLDDA